MGRATASLEKGRASGSPRRHTRSCCGGLGTIHSRGTHLLKMTKGALTQMQGEDTREQRDRDKAKERPDSGRSRVAVTGRYSTNAVTVPAEMVGKGGERLGASLMCPVRRGPRN